MTCRAWLSGLMLGCAVPAAAQSDFAERRAQWNRPTAPFRIIGNLSYVGTADLAAYLISGPDGHVLIDGAMEESAPQIAANIRQLGFAIEDVRYILVNHAHWDHAGGLAELKRQSGARIVAGAADAADLARGANLHRRDIAHFPPVAVERPVADGERLVVGPIVLTAHATAGHTPGCTSWSMRIRDGDRDLDILFACSLSVAGQRLVGDPGYPTAASDFEASFARLRALRADIFLSFHAGQFGFEQKSRRLRAGDPDAFVDPAELHQRINSAEAAYREALTAELAD